MFDARRRRTLAAALLALGVGAAHADGRSGIAWHLHLPAVSHHFGPPADETRSWNELHDGLGVQRTAVRDRRVSRMTAGFMRDSFGRQGLYLGAALGLRRQAHGWSFDATLAPMVLYRTRSFASSARAAIPLLLPMFSIEHRASGFGANLTALPAGNFGKQLRFPGLMFVQFTYRVR
ncbi:hypothetical protein FBR04_03270 [Betaproteobacteria bacterium PRO7]|nr:hypothetical protein [Burkholderiaceae bacterium]MDL1860037.1 hypothetical protein [Betaproteobacteria bacterium PRO7]GIL04053.1 MAG: hypothetical protein BroJett031_05730 [Betaproteobacteria bacterium]